MFDRVGALGVEVDCLINNAGFGDYGPFSKSDLAKQESMIGVNITALTALTRLFLPGDAGARTRTYSKHGIGSWVYAGPTDEWLFCHQTLCARVFGGSCGGVARHRRKSDGAVSAAGSHFVE